MRFCWKLSKFVSRQHGLIIFADEIYDCLVMDGAKHTAIASLAPDCSVPA